MPLVQVGDEAGKLVQARVVEHDARARLVPLDEVLAAVAALRVTGPALFLDVVGDLVLGTDRWKRLPRHLTNHEPSFLELNGIQ